MCCKKKTWLGRKKNGSQHIIPYPILSYHSTYMAVHIYDLSYRPNYITDTSIFDTRYTKRFVTKHSKKTCICCVKALKNNYLVAHIPNPIQRANKQNTIAVAAKAIPNLYPLFLSSLKNVGTIHDAIKKNHPTIFTVV